MKIVLGAAMGAVLAGPLWAKPPHFSLHAVEVYGTTQITGEDLERRFAVDLGRYVALRNQALSAGHRRAAQLEREAESVKSSLESQVLKSGDFAWTRMGLSENAVSDGSELYVTFEVVETKDKQGRMPFRPAPRGQVKDPSGLINAWNRYTELGWQLVRSGDLSVEHVTCPAFYCSWGSATPELKSYESRFMAEVPSYKPLLITVLHEDFDPVRRAGALYLLTYIKDGTEVSSIANYGLLDPDTRVREAALRIYADIAMYHKDIPIPIESVVAILNSPYAEDRTNALAALLGLADKPDYRPFLINRAVPQVLRLLRLKQPSNHQMARAFLGLISGENIGDRDYDGWEKWVFKARTALDAEKNPDNGKKSSILP